MVEDMKDINEEAPALPEALLAAQPANCTGELVQQEIEPGLTFNQYECQTCHQILNVGHEDLEANGLPVEHAPWPSPTVEL